MVNSDLDRGKYFRTIRGYLAGDEPDEPTYFAFSASLRIFGDSIPFDEITAQLGVGPTYAHRKGEKRKPTSEPFSHDAWHYSAGLDESCHLSEHIDVLWTVVQPHVEYLKSLKTRFNVDIFCGYRSNCDHAGFEVPHSCLKMFAELEVPFGMSIING